MIEFIALITSVVGNNVGAMKAIGNMMLCKEFVDPKAFGQSMFPVMTLSEWRFPPEDIFSFYAHMCSGSAVNCFVALRAVQHGFISQMELLKLIRVSHICTPKNWIENMKVRIHEISPGLLNTEYKHMELDGIEAMEKAMEKLTKEVEAFRSKEPTLT